MCQEQRILTTWTDHVEGGIALGCKPAPVCYGKIFGIACHASKEMIFPGVYGLFGGVCAMDVQRSVLDACLFGGNKKCNIFGSYVVKFMEEKFETVKS